MTERKSDRQVHLTTPTASSCRCTPAHPTELRPPAVLSSCRVAARTRPHLPGPRRARQPMPRTSAVSVFTGCWTALFHPESPYPHFLFASPAPIPTTGHPAECTYLACLWPVFPTHRSAPGRVTEVPSAWALGLRVPTRSPSEHDRPRHGHSCRGRDLCHAFCSCCWVSVAPGGC